MAGRQLGIQVGVVQRLQKEVVSYQKEAEDQRRAADKMQAEGVEEAKLRQQWKALQETLNIIPDSQKRLGDAVQKLKDLMYHTDESERDSDEFAKAQETLEYAYT